MNNHDFDLNEIPSNDIEVIVPNNNDNYYVIDLNIGGLDVEYPLLEVNFNEMYHEEDNDNIDEQQHENEDEVEDDGVEENSQNETTPGSFETFENRRSSQMLTNKEKQIVYDQLLRRSINGRLKKNHTTEVSNLLKLPIRTVQRIWKIHKNIPIGNPVDVSQKKTNNCGRKRIQLDINQVMDIPLSQRTSLRSLGAALGVQQSAIFKLLKEGLLRRHTNAVKPYLRDDNKISRLRFCMSMVDRVNLPHEPKFIGMFNFVHIDEKWFYLTKKSEKYYLLPIEEEPLRTCQSKNYICKVMFLVAMARPRFDTSGNEIFSGKIGVFPLVQMVAAQRRSRNRDVGTLEMKPITSVTRDIIRTCLIEKVIPAIKNVWPQESQNEVIYIQQDNARTHIEPNDPEFNMAASRSGLNLQIMYQPPNSPDLNILDLGFFSAIQSLQYKESPRNVEELVHAVVKSFNEYPSQKVNHVWITLQLCMLEILKIDGSNRYKIPHIKKLQLERIGQLPIQVACDPLVLQNVMESLN